MAGTTLTSLLSLQLGLDSSQKILKDYRLALPLMLFVFSGSAESSKSLKSTRA
jgi:hypothetical protein